MHLGTRLALPHVELRMTVCSLTVSSCKQQNVIMLAFLPDAQAQFRCLSSCNDSSSLLGTDQTVGGCCGPTGRNGGGYNVLADPSIACESCDDYRSKLWFLNIPIKISTVAIVLNARINSLHTGYALMDKL